MSANSKILSYLLRSTTTGLFNTILSGLTAVLFIPLLINTMGMTNYGIWAVLAIFTGIANTMDFGLSKSLVYFTAGKGESDTARQERSAIFLTHVAVLLLLAVVGGIALTAGVSIVPRGKIPQEYHFPIMVSGMAILGAAVMTAYFRATLEAEYRISRVNACYCLQTVLTYGSLWGISRFTPDPKPAVYATACVHVVILMVHIFLASRVTRIRPTVPPPRVFKKIYAYSWRIFCSGIAISLVLPLNRYLFIRLGGEMSAYGAFDASLKIALCALSLLTAFASPLFAHFSASGVKRIRETRKLLTRYLYLLTGLYLCGLFAFRWIGPFLIGLLFKENAAEIYANTFILLLGLGLCGVGEPFVKAVWALGGAGTALVVRIIQSSSNFLFMAFLFFLPVMERISCAYSAAYALGSLLFVGIFYFKYRSDA